jgi:hypothetical protein
MKIKKLFQVLVVGGATLGAVACGPGPDNNNGNNQNPLTSDGGTGGGNNDGGGGGTHFW